MDEQDRLEGVEPEGDVEAHGVKEVATVGLSAAALLAGSGTAAAATGAHHTAAAPAATHAVAKSQADPTQKIVDKKPDATIKLGSTNKAQDITLKRGIDAN
jgi:hypothetical protein